MSEKSGMWLRRIAIVLMGLAVVVTLLGGLGTTCVAFNASKFGVFSSFSDYSMEFQSIVVISVLTALVGFVALWGLVKGTSWAYALSLVVLVVGLITTGVQMYYASTLRNLPFLGAAPENMRFFATLITLVYFLVIRWPSIWKQVDFSKHGSAKGVGGPAAGVTACVMGLVTITTPFWAGSTHMMDGYNLVNVLDRELLLAGLAMIIAGVATVVLSLGGVSLRRVAEVLERVVVRA